MSDTLTNGVQRLVEEREKQARAKSLERARYEFKRADTAGRVADAEFWRTRMRRLESES